ncbi:MAG: Holliday junction branch migration protein RuvA [Candidatus Saganbacteria bacterium]|nr:Holliday junction branch migration protein RuvA [Candidatus Saganbacteria bacterium]
MIGHIEGIFEGAENDKITVDVNGIGYEITVTNSVLRKLPKKGEKIKVITYLNVREDLMQLFGFSSKEEKGLFGHLLSVSGIGPKGAMNMVSSFDINRLVVAITKGDVGLLTSAQGVGKKTAERVIVELREKLGKIYMLETESGSSTQALENPVIKDAASALMVLGYSAKEAKQAIMESGADLSGNMQIEEIIKRSLKALA